eukprot:TRINITY_DN77448_c0_g1_i1.p2 TRINITY_DN77448_c0_g1~~TRINITY_DN77448_c0_g1_i1.p2  ORF type:complete len:109 (+),score=9.66 TRINITY_DN77448_c0_g1_i1:265-591(+)
MHPRSYMHSHKRSQTWKKIIRQLAEKADDGTTIDAPDAPDEEHPEGDEEGQRVAAPPQYECGDCGQTFGTRQGWTLHSAKAHGRISDFSKVTRSQICGWCMKDCGSRP